MARPSARAAVGSNRYHDQVINDTVNFAFAIPPAQIPWFTAAGVLAVFLAAWALRRLDRVRAKRLAQFVEQRLGDRLLLNYNARLRRPLSWFTLIGFVFLLIALAQPHWGQAWQEVHQRSHDVLVLLDVSESMRVENPLPNRLERAKQKIEALLDRSAGDRFGLIAFSGAPELMCPLTLDHGYFKSVLNAVDTDSISYEGTDIAAALELAGTIFEKQDQEMGEATKDTRAVLLVSDGEAVEGDAAAASAALAEYARVFVIGVGDPRGAPVKYSAEYQGRRLAMATGEAHVSKLDEAGLQIVAVRGEGGYTRSTPGNDDIELVHGLMQTLAEREVSSDIRLQLVNRYQWPLAISIICFALEGLWLVLMPALQRLSLPRRRKEEAPQYA
ncbi:MAG: VWA domain-containing protein [Candidatus Hydrogenedentales bacterium]